MDRPRSDQDRNERKFDRRHVLKSAGAVGSIGWAAGLGKAKPTGENVHLVEIGFRTQESFPQGCELPIPDHIVEGQTLYVPDWNSQIWNHTNSPSPIVYSPKLEEKYRDIPTTVFNSSTRCQVSTEVNQSLRSSQSLSLRKPLPFPTIRLASSDSDDVEVSSGNMSIILGPGETKQLVLGSRAVHRPPESKGGETRRIQLTQIVAARNTGVLDVEELNFEEESGTPPSS